MTWHLNIAHNCFMPRQPQRKENGINQKRSMWIRCGESCNVYYVDVGLLPEAFSDLVSRPGLVKGKSRCQVAEPSSFILCISQRQGREQQTPALGCCLHSAYRTLRLRSAENDKSRQRIKKVLAIKNDLDRPEFW